MQIIYEDNHLLIVNKSCSEIVQGDKTGDKSLLDDLKTYIKVKYKKPGDVFLGLVHRLDRPTSGLVIFAKTSKALSRMNKIFKEKSLKKIYWAVVDKAPPKRDGILINYLIKNHYFVPSITLLCPIRYFVLFRPLHCCVVSVTLLCRVRYSFHLCSSCFLWFSLCNKHCST